MMDLGDIRIRKQWLVLFSLNLVQTAVWHFLMFFCNPLFNNGIVSYVYLISGLLGAFGFSYALYHCAYKKLGTKFLTLVLVISFAALFSTPALFLMGKMVPPSYIPFYTGLQILSYGFSICWIIASWRMRKVNQKLISCSTFYKASGS